MISTIFRTFNKVAGENTSSDSDESALALTRGARKWRFAGVATIDSEGFFQLLSAES